MKLEYYVERDYDAMSFAAYELIRDRLLERPDGLYCFAGGDTPVGALRLLAEAAKSGEVDLSRASFVELDEWVGLDRSNPGSCASYLKRNLFDSAGVSEDRVHLFDPMAADLTKECDRAVNFVEEHGGIELALLGVGVNGHFGFNEPGVSFDERAHVIDLSDTTVTVGAKYFTDAAEVDRSRGITLGIGTLMESRNLVVVANGPKKRKAIAEALKGTVAPEWPVTALWTHPHPQLVIDQAVFG